MKQLTRSYLGVNLQDIDRNLAEAYRLSKPEGALITQIAPSSPAARAGLKEGDVILKFNNNAISRAADLLNYLNRTQPNQSIDLEVLRDERKRNISATLGSAPDDTPAKGQSELQKRGPILGVSIRNLSEAELTRLNLKGGIYIQDVQSGGLAAQARIQSGDIVTQVNGKAIENTTEFANTIAELKLGTVARIGLVRQGQRVVIGMRIQ